MSKLDQEEMFWNEDNAELQVINTFGKEVFNVVFWVKSSLGEEY